MSDSSTPQNAAPPRKSMSPLAIVLALSAAFFAVFLVVSGLVYLRKSKSGASGTGGAIFSEGSVGIIELNGVIMDSKRVVRRIESMADSKEVKAVVLRINSPGGAVAPSQEIYEAVKKVKKPVVASMASVAASGGFYVAMGAKKVFANPGTITGSIGVIMEFANLEKLYDWAKVKRFVIKTGKFKDAGAEYRDMEPDERALLQGMVDNVLGQFKQAVAEGRKMPVEKVTQVADGRIFSGQQAKELNLVDELGTLNDAIAAAAEMAGLKGKPKVVYPESPRKKLLEFLMDDGSDEDEVRYGGGGVVGALARVLGGEGSLVASAGRNPVTGMAPGVYWLWTGGH